MEKPFSQACANNSDIILKQLHRLLSSAKSVLEIGSGTGQHAAHFAKNLPELTWQTSDVVANHAGINLWVDDTNVSNLLAPIAFDVTQSEFLGKKYNAIFMANTLHIMPWLAVEQCIEKAAQQLTKNGLLIVYGPFNYNGAYTSHSNAAFDQWLKAAQSERGIRDFEKVNQLASEHDFILAEDNAMPANNRLLVWQLGT